MFQKRKQPTPMKFMKEASLLEKTVDRKELSTSISTEGDDDSLQRMVKRTQTRAIRQETAAVSFQGC